MLQSPADVAGQGLHGFDLRLGPPPAEAGPQQGEAAEQFLAGPERRQQQRGGALAEQDLLDLGRDLLGLRGVQVLDPVTRPVPVDVPDPADRVRREVADDVGEVTAGTGVTVGQGEPFAGDDADPDEVDGQVLVDRGHRLPDHRVGAQMLADPDRGLPDLGLQPGALLLCLLDAVALVGEEVDGGGQVPHVGRATGERARRHVAQGAPAHRAGDIVQRATDPAQAQRDGDHREHQPERKNGCGPAQAHPQGPLALRGEDPAFGREIPPQLVGMPGERAAARRGLVVEPCRRAAALAGRHGLLVGLEGGLGRG